MKQKRRISAIVRRLEKANRTAEVATALKTLQWVLGEVGDFSEIIPEVREPQPRLNTELFAYDKEHLVWVMDDPMNEGAVYIAEQRPSHTPPNWWRREDLSSITQDISFGEDYLEIELSYGDRESLSWVEVDNVFSHFKGMFKTRDVCASFLTHYYKIDWTGYLELTPEERASFKRNSRYLKGAIEKELSCEFKYEYKRKGEMIWVMKKIE